MAESGLFLVQFNEQGKTYLRKFVRISYTVMGLAVFGSGVSIYWSIKDILISENAGIISGYNFFPLLWICKDIMAIASNVYFSRFPQILLRAVEQGNEERANWSFLVLLRSAWTFLLILILDTAEIAWRIL